MNTAIRISEQVLYILRDAYATLQLIDDETLNETAKANLREIRSWAISITNYVNTILAKAGECDDERLLR